MTGQIPLDLARAPDYSKRRFVPAASNGEAIAALADVDAWSNGALAIIGPKGSGKTHIGALWSAEHNALQMTHNDDIEDAARSRGRAVFIDDAARAREGLLFALINMAIRADISALLLTDSAPPASWPVDIPDLRSRLGALRIARVYAPDDELLEAIMRKLFLDRGLKVSDSLIQYLLARIERSVDAAYDAVSELDHAAAIAKVNVTRSFAVQYYSAKEQGALF